MIISEFYDYVRQLTDANTRDFSDAEIARIADEEAKYLYELTIQGNHIQQTKNQTPTVLTFTQTAPFQATSHNLWIERVEVSIDGGDTFYRIDKTTNTEYELYQEECGDSLTDDLAETDGKPTSFVQTSQGINVFPFKDDVITKIYIKDTPVIDWGNNNYELLLPDVPVNLLALKTALMYRDIQDINRLQFLQTEYSNKFAVFMKRIAKGSQAMQMRQRTRGLGDIPKGMRMRSGYDNKIIQ